MRFLLLVFRFFVACFIFSIASMTAFWQDVLADICVGSGYGERVRDLYG